MVNNNNVQNVKFLRNGSLFATRKAARTALNEFELTYEKDGTAILARYGSDDAVKTLVGWVYANNSGNKSITIFDIDDAGTDAKAYVDSLVGTGITSANTATSQLEALSGNNKSTSAQTSVEGAKRYADGLKDAMDYTGLTADENKVVYNVTEADGIVAAEAKNISSVKLAGYAVGSDDKISATDTLGEALGKLQGQINGMDLTVVSGNGEVITAVSEEDGKVSASKTAIKDVKLTGYAKNTTATGAISETDDIEDALSKLENTIGSNAITNVDGSITVTPANGSTTDVKVHIKSGENVIKLDGEGGGIYTDIKLSAITVSDTNVKEAWGLFTGTEQLGSTIKIYKDSAYKEIYLGTAADTIDTTKGTITKLDGDKQSLNYAYVKADGTYDLVKVDVSAFLSEEEFADGLHINNHKVSVKVDTSSEQVTTGDNATVDVLTVGSNGVKVSNIQNAIDYSISKLDANVTGGDITSNHVQVVVDEVDGKLTAVTVNEANIADANKLADLSGKTVTEVASSNGSIAATLSAATNGTKHLDIITDASKIKMTGFTKPDALSGITESSSVTQALLKVDNVITEQAEVISTALNDLEATKAEKTALDAEIAARKDVDGQSGPKYAANTSANYISGATSLNDADIKLNNALASLDTDVIKSVKVNDVKLAGTSNAVNVQISSVKASGTDSSPIVVNTDNNTGAVTLQILQIDCGVY